MRTLVLAVLAVLALPASALGQPCTPILRGYQCGPRNIIDDIPDEASFVGAITSFDDGGGNALYIAGRFVISTECCGSNVARYRAGVWVGMNTSIGGASAKG